MMGHRGLQCRLCWYNWHKTGLLSASLASVLALPPESPCHHCSCGPRLCARSPAAATRMAVALTLAGRPRASAVSSRLGGCLAKYVAPPSAVYCAATSTLAAVPLAGAAAPAPWPARDRHRCRLLVRHRDAADRPTAVRGGPHLAVVTASTSSPSSVCRVWATKRNNARKS